MDFQPQVTISVISNGLRPEETIVQILTTIDTLEQVIADVFANINASIARYENILENFRPRLDCLKIKLEKLSNKKTATVLLSDSEFPSTDDIFKKGFKKIYDFEIKKPPSLPVPINESFHASKNPFSSKLQFFHVQVEDNNRDIPNGLGNTLPDDFNFVSSLVLFNGSCNVYKTAEQAKVKGKPIKINKNNDAVKISPAPFSLSKDVVSNTDYYDCFYKPSTQIVPNIDVPLDLPNLSGIAEDNYDVVDEKFSLTNKSNDNQSREICANTEVKIQFGENISNTWNSKDEKEASVSNLDDNTVVTDNKYNDSVIKSNSNENGITSDVECCDHNNMKSNLNSQLNDKNANESRQHFLEKSEVVETKKQKDASVAEGGHDFHSGLMEEILKSGGKNKLRKVSQEENVPKRNNSSANNLMSDLYNKLALRRKGISGALTQNKLNVAARLSAMIESVSDTSDIEEEKTEEWSE